MTGNTFGVLFSVTSYGESHGHSIGCIVDGCPAGLDLSPQVIQEDLERRRPGKSRNTSQRREPDKIEILSGVFDGKTTGAPIGLMVKNIDGRSRDYEAIKDSFRPGHADYTYYKKYGHRDYRGGGRSSARETAMRVAAGAIARTYLKENSGVVVQGALTKMGPIDIEPLNWSVVNDNPFFCPNPSKIGELENLIETVRREGDSIGAELTIVGRNIPAGLGDPIFDRLDADIARAMMSINAVKGVSIGAGFDSVRQKGSDHRDEITPDGFLSNNAGGTLGGISTGQDIVVRIALKPTSSIQIPGKTIDTKGNPANIITTGRHDPCVGIRAVPVAEAMLLLVLMDHLLRDRGACHNHSKKK